MNRKPKITVVGSYAAGLTMRVPRFPTSGETLMGSQFKKLHGGKGSNQAIACARLGAAVSLVACLGRDGYAEEAMELYLRESVDVGGVRRSNDKPTGVGIILVDDQGNNEIVVDFGANLDLTPQLVMDQRELLSSADAILLQMEIPTETVCAAMELACETDTLTILNPAPYNPIPQSMWCRATLVTPNEKEAKLILGYHPDKRISVEDLGDSLLKMGIRQAVLTLGERGAYVVSRQGCQHIPAHPVRIVDTTGAGDTFSAALAVALCEGQTLTQAAAFAVRAAAQTVTKMGVVEALPYRKDLA